MALAAGRSQWDLSATYSKLQFLQRVVFRKPHVEQVNIADSQWNV